MVVILALAFKALHAYGTVVVDNFGLVGALVACAIFYCAGVIIERR